jgi:putative transposase
VVGITEPSQTDGMTPDLATHPGYRFPAEIISHAVWLYHVFSLSLQDVELILVERGITVTHESIRCIPKGKINPPLQFAGVPAN